MPQQRTLLVFGGRFRRRRRRSSPRETGTFSLLMREGKYVDAGKYVFLLLLQGKCSDILKWRSFYATHDTAWKAHYREVFDHAIREALCCLGRAKYLIA
ncbi:uncharacterized protein LOC109703947 isoform X5 [Ananas comosus]|uniref:Uncharacterized protein LOC109703947 isoform X5 n=1 Tax=Ananas comosus TaxID=4615 RepID=A0A6P5EAJ5_ANACO|nr:uncharacterized protein LOC109703947 isoform X5 [Ananas comosus]